MDRVILPARRFTFPGKGPGSVGLPVLIYLLVLLLPALSWSSQDLRAESPGELQSGQGESRLKEWLTPPRSDWGGHLKLYGSVSMPDEGSILAPDGGRPFVDGSVELRLKNELTFTDWAYLETHYETVLSGGDTREAGSKAGRDIPFGSGVFFRGPIDDDRRLLDLTGVITEEDRSIWYQRIDRLALTVTREGNFVRIGRQAITWGHGLLFNPMDLFNPFAPTDIERDYKIGDDMAVAQINLPAGGDLQALYVPRRNRESGDVEWNQSSLAGKWRFPLSTTEIEILAAKHFNDEVIGVGGTGYLGGAAWRTDAVWTFLHRSGFPEGYLSLVANIDASWVWWDRNMYGFVELFYSGLGKSDYQEALEDLDLVERIERGDLFTLGRTYLAGHMRIELHPLFNAFLTVITNLEDPSSVLQPRAAWNASEDIQITFGFNIFCGAEESEFGGFRIPDTGLSTAPPDSGFLWLSYYF